MSLAELTPVQLDRERQLLFDRRAIRAIELDLTRLWGQPYTFYQAMRGLSEMLLESDLAKLSYINIATLLWRGCLHEDATLTLAQVEDALPYADMLKMMLLAGTILEAWGKVSPPLEAANERSEVQDTNPLAASTGVPSGPSSVPASA